MNSCEDSFKKEERGEDYFQAREHKQTHMGVHVNNATSNLVKLPSGTITLNRAGSGRAQSCSGAAQVAYLWLTSYPCVTHA